MSTWVLLRGLARDSRHWESFPSLLRDATGAEVITLDLPGNGSLHRQRSLSSVAAMVAAYRAQLGQRPATVHLLGLSLGAMAALEWARRHPQEISSTVLVNASAAGLSAPWRRMRPQAAWGLLTSARTESAIVAACSNLADHDGVVARWTQYARSGRTSPANVARQLFAALRFRLPEERSRVPALVIASAADRLVSVECSIAIARRRSWPFLLHPSAGHEIALDDPAWLARQCARWQAGLEHHRS